jgi:aspartate kinase
VRVLKFGGTSVGDPARIVNACEIIAQRAKQDTLVVVVSAASKVTDMLLSMAGHVAAGGTVDITALEHRVNGILSAFSLAETTIAHELVALRTLLDALAKHRSLTAELSDHIVSFGERISARTVAAILNGRGLRAQALDAFSIGMVTDSNFGSAEPLPESESLIHNALAAHPMDIAVVTGFIGATEDGRITTLGRGGSDYSAAIIGAAVNATEIEIWTDVDGVMSADPRVVAEAKTIPSLSFTEAAELAYFGAKVLHPKTIHPAVRKSIPVRVLNTFRPEAKGTVITADGAGIDSDQPARAMAAKKGITVVQIVSTRMLLAHGFLAKIFEAFARHRIVVDLVATSEVSVSLTIESDENLPRALSELRRFADVQVITGRALVAVVGLGIGDALGIAGRVFGALAAARVNIELISAGSGRANMSMVVAEQDADRAVCALHAALYS